MNAQKSRFINVNAKCISSLFYKELSHCRKFIAILTLLFFSQTKAEAQQNGNYNLRTVIPASATTASLGKYGEIPVALYTGIPNISIPLYEIKDGALNLPVSLSYHAGGIKVEEEASNVGIGWSLNAGGVIGRQIRGYADEFGWITPSYNRLENLTGSAYNTATLNIENGSRDSQADIFYYNFNGRSGKFFIDQDGEVHGYPVNGLLISTLRGSQFTGAGLGWKITTEDGTVYEFDKAERSYTDMCGTESLENVTAWFITKIKSADGAREITFTYNSVNYMRPVFLGETRYMYLSGYGYESISNSGSCGGNNVINSYQLTRIDFSEGYLKFNYSSTERLDLPGEKAIDQIEIYNQANQLIKKFDFAYDYFGAGSGSSSTRLKLTSLTEKSPTGQKPPYIFTYNESLQALHKNDYSRDYWGYYNGKSNSTLIPGKKVGNYIYPGADRRANPEVSQAFMLKKIKYPTGGETEFTYENNTAANPPEAYLPIVHNYHFLSAPNIPYSTITSPYETEEFVIPTGGSLAEIHAEGFDNNLVNCDAFQAYLLKDGVNYRYLTDVHTETIFLPAGTYKIRVVYDCYRNNLYFQYNVHTMTTDASANNAAWVGGLRIKEIINQPGDGGQPTIKKYRYIVENDPLHPSSGQLVNYSDYTYDLHVNTRLPSSYYGCDNPIFGDHYYLVSQSLSNYPLATTAGGYVGYTEVTENFENNGEIRHHYSMHPDPYRAFPFPPHENYDWWRGLESSTEYLGWKNNSLIPLKAITYGYKSVFKKDIAGYMPGRNDIWIGGCVIQQVAPLATYWVVSEFFSPSFVKERIYDPNDASKYTETTTNYTYNNSHYQLAQVSTSTSSGSNNAINIVNEVVTNKKYAQDYVFTGVPTNNEAIGIKNLQDLHVTGVPIEEYTYRQTKDASVHTIPNPTVSNQQIIGGTITTFKPSKPYPEQVYRLETAVPIPLSTFGTGSGLSSNSFVTNNTAYSPALTFYSYDDKGNLLQQQKTDAPSTAYIWGYNKQYPVAEVKNATYQDLVAALTQTVVDLLNGNTLSDTQIRGYMATLRTALPNALVTTYTYAPLVGITSSTDAKGMTTYYEYDDFQRLVNIKDKDGNIIKHTDYNYKQ